MQKPQAYDETQAMGEWTPVELGGHHMVIKQVNERKGNNNQDQVVVLFDFDQNDTQPGYFNESFRNDIRPDKKWPNQGTAYINVKDNEGNTSKSFKTFCTCVEHSNTGFEVRWGIDNWGAQFKGKKIGGVFGEQMDFYNGKESKKRVMRWFISTDKVQDAKVPDITESQAYKDHKSVNTGDFMNIPDGLDEELPFA